MCGRLLKEQLMLFLGCIENPAFDSRKGSDDPGIEVRLELRGVG